MLSVSCVLSVLGLLCVTRLLPLTCRTELTVGQQLGHVLWDALPPPPTVSGTTVAQEALALQVEWVQVVIPTMQVSSLTAAILLDHNQVQSTVCR